MKVLGWIFLAVIAFAVLSRITSQPQTQSGAPVAGLGNPDSASRSAPACSPRDISIIKPNWSIEREYVHVNGEFHNGCSVAVGVQMQAVFKDASGTVVMSEDFWPASTRNIPPGANSGIGYMTELRGHPTSMTIEATEVHQW